MQDPNTVFLSLASPRMDPLEFTPQHRQSLIQSIEMVLGNFGHSDVIANVHGIELLDDQQSMR